jgi:CoA:oxalate CoA-transferase
MRLNRGKQSIALDLKSDAGKEALRQLLTRADVLVENYRPGVLAALGFPDSVLRELNPRLVYCSITGFGHTESGHRNRPAFNLIAEYEAGVYRQSADGAEPAPLGPYLGDLVPGMQALSGIVMALFRRSISGRGGRVDIAMFDSMVSLNEAAASTADWIGEQTSTALASNFCPSGVFPAGDGYVCVDVVTDPQWRTLCQLIGHPGLADHPDLLTGPDRVCHYADLLATPLLDWLGRRSCEQVVELLSSRGVPAAMVRDPRQVLASDQAIARGLVVEVDQRGRAPMRVPASPIRIDDRAVHGSGAVPALGEHTEQVLRTLTELTDEQRRQIFAALQS